MYFTKATAPTTRVKLTTAPWFCTVSGVFSFLLLLSAFFSIPPAWAADDVAKTESAQVKNVVLIHGLFADGSSWNKLIPLLQAKGLHVVAVQHPTLSFESDVAAVKRVLAQQDGPTVLVGHSYGGMLATEVGNDPKVVGLVYVAARAPDAGEDYPALTRKFTPAPASNGLQWTSDGYGALSEQAFIRDFAGDLPPSEAQALYAVQLPMGKAITAAKTTVASWRDKPTWYLVSRNDHTIDPDLQRFMAARMHAHVVELDASHVSMLSHPDDVAQVVFQAVRSRQQQ